MPNTIKYSTTGDTQSLKDGNFYFGVGDVGKGATSGTSYWNGISPPTSGYTIYINKASNGPSIYVASNDTQLINYTKGFSGQNFTGATQCLNWYLTQSNYACVNRDYETIITSGLSLCLDAGFTPSYSTSGVTWYDISYSGNNGTLTNGPTFDSSNGGSIVFDGVDDYVVRNSSVNTGQDFSVFAWIKPGAINVRNGIVGNSYPYSSGSGWFFSTATNYNGNLNTFFISIGRDDAYRMASNSSLTLNTWNYVGGTVTNGGQNIKLYVNGVETGYSGGILATNTVNYTTQEFNVGRRYSANPEPFNGSISIVQIYNRVLSASEILQNYNAQKSRYVASFDPDAQAFITAANITNSTQQTAINNLVVGLKADGLWTNMTAIYPFVGGTATTHKWNLRNTATNQLTFFGGFTHDSNGVTGNGTNSYATTNIYNSATLGIYSRSSNPSGAFVGKRKANEPVEGSQYNVTESSLFGYVYNGNVGQYNLGSSPYNKFYNVSNGVTGAANEVKVYRNGTNVVLSSAAGATPPSSANEYYLFANPNEITFDETGQTRIDIYDNSNANIALALFSNTTLDSTQNTNLNNRVVTFQTELSRNV